MDTVNEIAQRSLKPFMTDRVLNLTQEHLLSLASKSQIPKYILHKILRDLTNGSIADLSRFFLQHFEFHLATPEIPFVLIEEIFDRRHLFVHNGGIVDNIYLRKYPTSSLIEGKEAQITEEYLLKSISVFETIALHVKREVETKFPAEPDWVRSNGQLLLPDCTQQLLHVEFSSGHVDIISKLIDMNRVIGGKKTLGEITVWSSTNGVKARIVIGGNQRLMHILISELFRNYEVGELTSLRITKVMG